ncbi:MULTISPECIES: AAA-like domain-containing protein [unclassified Nodularia (in: cyanobacteria)]|uniref:AAA-like domain-containing protein n=1 Tax=unclassified Nodularia (in: cyanobacteria) TaxID=2656917 RepID=UPI00187DE74B|nr:MULTISPECIES: AAA-like domain-containing protein [unclassified Nodularia (in: cyanobacteria)]MBE9200679.1 AAA-like domain-containing protein [Nodularia sp. LEGE 06071]MCC2694790.1 AAA-like domain-containing protein [Nodularia sp. LEGE 04288]
MIIDNPIKRILLLSANPIGSKYLRLDEEMREIQEGLKRSKNREQYSIAIAQAVRYRDIHRAILEYEPQIIHFSGHGAGEEGLLFEDESGQVKFVDAEALAGLFQLFAEQVECVVLNACYSQYQAKEIAQHINYVVGMSQEIGDRAAIEFAVGFYDALGANKGYEFAYKLGCNLIRVAGIAENLTPQMIISENRQFSNEPNKLFENSTPKLDTTIYIERPPIEDKCYNAIIQPGALIRTKAPQKMGKTLLLENILDYARQQGYQTAKIDLQLADIEILANLKTFLQWLCVDVADSLDLEPQLDKYWQEVFGLNKNCTRYFQKYLLSVTDSPLVLAIDNFERLFDYPEIFPQFCLLMRGWYESAKQGDKIGNIWKKLRLIVVHSTEAYPALDTNHSPFNVGLAIDLPEFNRQQVANLAQQHELAGKLGEQGLSALMGMVGGHPYLVQQAITSLNSANAYQKCQQVTLEELLRLAPTEQGIFSDHLRQQLWHLQHNPQLELGYKKVVMTNTPVRLDTEIAFKLHSLGLVKLSNNDCIPSCDLYRQYFSNRLG